MADEHPRRDGHPGALGIRKRVALSTEQRSRLRKLVEAFGFKPKRHREAVSGARIGGNEAA